MGKMALRCHVICEMGNANYERGRNENEKLLAASWEAKKTKLLISVPTM